MAELTGDGAPDLLDAVVDSQPQAEALERGSGGPGRVRDRLERAGIPAEPSEAA